jgi:hypothetical protein
MGRCTKGEHRCVALMLAFFDIVEHGCIQPRTRVAIARCEAGL